MTANSDNKSLSFGNFFGRGNPNLTKPPPIAAPSFNFSATPAFNFGTVPKTEAPKTGFSYSPLHFSVPGGKEKWAQQVFDYARKYGPYLDESENILKPDATSGRFTKTDTLNNHGDYKFKFVEYTAKAHGRARERIGFKGPRRNQARSDKMDYDEKKGSHALETSVEGKRSNVEVLKKQVKDLCSIIGQVDDLSMDLAGKVVEQSRRLKEQRRKLFLIMERIEVLANHGAPVSIEELGFGQKLDALSSRLAQPLETLDELSMIQRQYEKAELSTKWCNQMIINQEDISALKSVLIKQDNGIGHLLKILKKDKRDIELAGRALGRGRRTGYR